MMRRHAPSVLAAVLLVAVSLAAAAFAIRSSVAPSTEPSPASGPAAGPSELTTSFSVVDTQATATRRTITAPLRVYGVYDTPQRRAETLRRLQAHNADFYVPPPDYLLSQGIVRVLGTGKRVAITFDDGPSGNTAEILRILSRYDAHATFFMVGVRVQVSPDLARAVVAQGSELGNHTMMHSELRDQSVQRDESDIMSADQVIYEAAGVHPVFVRPKGGQLDADGLDAVRELQRIYVYWDVAGFDTVKSFTSAEIRDTVVGDARPGSVILLHETNAKTVAALPGIIEGLRRRGYEVQSLSELLIR